MPRFAILMYETNDAWHNKPQAEKDALLQRYGAWIKDLRASGAFMAARRRGGGRGSRGRTRHGSSGWRLAMSC